MDKKYQTPVGIDPPAEGLRGEVKNSVQRVKRKKKRPHFLTEKIKVIEDVCATFNKVSTAKNGEKCQDTFPKM